jgi:uncharacterized glyoxalase superfamily protein PhnB
MIANRSMPTDTVLPHLVYQNVADAIVWITKAFGFEEYYRYGEPGVPVNGAQMHLAHAWIMLMQECKDRVSPARVGYATQSLTVFVEDVEAHFQRAKAAGAKIVEKLNETGYGELQYGAEELDGHHWLFSRHARDVSSEEWGARALKVKSRVQMLPRPRLCYMEIPALDVAQSVNSCEKVHGLWVGRFHARRGILPYIWVDSIDGTLRKFRRTAAWSSRSRISIRQGDAGSPRCVTRREM